MTEIWRDVPVKEYKSYYEVSNLGRVRSKKRTVENSKGIKLNYNGKILKPSECGGYCYVRLGNGKDKLRVFTVHRLVALAFIPNPDNLPEINHKDENKGNNKADNLEWCSRSYNSNYNNLFKKRKYRVAVEQLDLDGNHIAYYRSLNEVGRHGYEKHRVSYCIKGYLENALGYIWREV